jgi:hypothetical protein
VFGRDSNQVLDLTNDQVSLADGFPLSFDQPFEKLRLDINQSL